MGVSSHKSKANQSVFGRNCGRDDGSDKDAFFENHVSEDESFLGVADEERDDRRLSMTDFESKVLESLHSVVSVVPQSYVAFGFGAHNVESFENGSSGGRSNGGGEDIGTDVVFHVVNGFLIGSDETANGSEGFGESTHNNLNIGKFVEMVAGAASFTAKNAQTVGLVDHKGGLVLVAEVDHLVDWSHIAFHRENAVGHHQFGSLDGAFLELTLKVFHIEVLIFHGSGEGDLLAFHDRSVVQLVEKDVVVPASDAGDSAGIGLETSREEHDTVFAHKLGQFVLKFDVDVECTVEEGGACTTGAIFGNSGHSCLLDFRMVSKSQIGIGTKHQYFLVIN